MAMAAFGLSRIPTANSPWLSEDDFICYIEPSGYYYSSDSGINNTASYGTFCSPFTFDDYNVMCTRFDGYVLYNNGVGLGSSYGTLRTLTLVFGKMIHCM